jgi:hypothetical protein
MGSVVIKDGRMGSGVIMHKDTFDEDNTHNDVERILDHFSDLAVKAVFAKDRHHDAVFHQADAARIHERVLSHGDALEC